MSRTFIYARCSTQDQTPENQVREIEAAGFSVAPSRVITEIISGSTAAEQRPEFARLLDRLEEGDILVVTKLDRLGRNAMDIRATVERLENRGVHVHCQALGGMDLTSAAGKMTMGVIAAVAEFERDLLVERTHAGLARAKAEGKKMGRPESLSPAKVEEVRAQRQRGASLNQLAKIFKVGKGTIVRALGGAPA